MRLFEACVQVGFAPRIVQQVVEIPAVLNLVAAGLGVALVPASMAMLRADAVGTCSLLGPARAAGAGTARRTRKVAAGSDLNRHGPLNGDVYVLWRTEDAAPAVSQFKNLLLDWAATLPDFARQGVDPVNIPGI